MARRSRSKASPAVTISIVVGLLIAGVGVFALANRGTDPFAKLTELPVEDFTRNGSSLGGNSYKITGIVDDKLRYTSDHGQVISVSVDGTPLGLFVPPKFSGENISRGDRFTFKVEVKQHAILHVLDLAKS